MRQKPWTTSTPYACITNVSWSRGAEGQNWRAGQPVDVTTKTSPVSMPNVNQCRLLPMPCVQDADVIQSLTAPVPTNQTTSPNRRTRQTTIACTP